MPCRAPVHKDNLVFSTRQRLEMLNIALQDFPGLKIDQREINRTSDSYSIDSLKEIAGEYPNETICLIIGMDSFNQLSTWKEYQDFTNYCHLIVMARPDNQNQQNYCNFSLTDTVNDLQINKTGLIYFSKTKMLDISSSNIRGILSSSTINGKIRSEKSLAGLLPAGIINYLNTL